MNYRQKFTIPLSAKLHHIMSKNNASILININRKIIVKGPRVPKTRVHVHSIYLTIRRNYLYFRNTVFTVSSVTTRIIELVEQMEAGERTFK